MLLLRLKLIYHNKKYEEFVSGSPKKLWSGVKKNLEWFIFLFLSKILCDSTSLSSVGCLFVSAWVWVCIKVSLYICQRSKGSDRDSKSKVDDSCQGMGGVTWNFLDVSYPGLLKLNIKIKLIFISKLTVFQYRPPIGNNFFGFNIPQGACNYESLNELSYIS